MLTEKRKKRINELCNKLDRLTQKRHNYDYEDDEIPF